MGKVFMIWVLGIVLAFSGLSSAVESALIADNGRLVLPSELPGSFLVSVPFQGQKLDLELQKSEVFGENTRFLVDDGTGKLAEIEAGQDRSYLGNVLGHPTFTVSAVLAENGLVANIVRPGQESITIEPLDSSSGNQLHKICLNQTNDYSSVANILTSDINETTMAASVAPITMVPSALTTAVMQAVSKSTATLKPSRVMDVLEYEIGVEIGSRSFFASSSYGGNIDKAKASAQSIVANLDARYLRGAGIKHRLGTVLIRTNADTDPLRDKVTATGASSKARGSLAAFKDYWNNNPDVVGKTHDLAVYHVKSAPSGLSYMNSVGSGNRYATCGGNGATSWANGTLVHEFGHSWGLKHNNSSGMFYESKPRNFAGSHEAGGSDVHVSVMHGGGSHNIGRLSTEEANSVYNFRQKKRSYGDLIANPGQIPPFGQYDRSFTVDGKSVTIDVIANDIDCNNDVLDVQILDTVSQKGGKITLSAGTGPGGRNELTYTPPAGYVGSDFFHYTVFDTAGGKDWGAVYVANDGPIVVDTKAKLYNYDLGSLGSSVEANWTLISPTTTGDVFWSGAEVKAADRGSRNGVNNINRDIIYGSARTTLNHKIANGVWEITINMGDLTVAHDNMAVRAEGRLLGLNVNSKAGEFPYVKGEVTVTDGQLNIDFDDMGGEDSSWAITRLSLQRK